MQQWKNLWMLSVFAKNPKIAYMAKEFDIGAISWLPRLLGTPRTAGCHSISQSQTHTRRTLRDGSIVRCMEVGVASWLPQRSQAVTKVTLLEYFL